MIRILKLLIFQFMAYEFTSTLKQELFNSILQKHVKGNLGWLITLVTTAYSCGFDLACLVYTQQDPLIMGHKTKYSDRTQSHHQTWNGSKLCLLFLSEIFCTFVLYYIYTYGKLYKDRQILKNTDADRRMLRATRSIYELRMFRRETLLWTNILNRCPAPLSRSPMLHSNTCNWSSSQTTAFLL